MSTLPRCAAILSLLAALTPALAQSPAGEPPCGPYRVAFYEFGSLYYMNEQGEYVGIDKDVVDEVARRSGCVFNGVLDARARTWAHLADGSLDISVSGLPSPEAEKFASFVPYFQSRNHVLLRKESTTGVTSLRAFVEHPGLRLAVVRGFRHGPSLDAWIAQLRALNRVDEYPDGEVVAHILSLGRADACISLPGIWAPLLRRNHLENQVQIQDWANADVIVGALVLSRAKVSPEHTERLRKVVESMRQDGTLEAIFARHVGKDIARQMSRR